MLVQIKNEVGLLNDFLDDLAHYLKTSQSERQLVEKVSLRLSELLAHREREWLPRQFLRPRQDTYSQYPLYIAPDGTFCVTALAFSPGAATNVHDHRVWGVVGVYQGLEEQVMYERTGDGWVRPERTVASRPGECSYLLPPDEEIHCVSNPTGDCSVSIHIYGADIQKVPRRAYCFATRQITTVYSRYETD